MKILVSCANGAGTSLMLKMKVEKACNDLDIKIDEIKHCSISEAKSLGRNYDIIFCSQNFTNMFSDAEKSGTTIIGMKNILSLDEAKDKLKATGFSNA